MAPHALLHRDRPVAALSPHDTVGGTNWGACFFGWLVALGVVTLLLLSVATAATGVGMLRGWSLDDVRAHAPDLAVAAAVATTVAAFVGYYAGGYVAGRMSRFDSVRQGIGLWVIGLLTTVIAGGLAALVDTRTHVLPRSESVPGDLTAGDVTVGAAVTGAALIALTLLGAVLGSAVGCRYHRRVDPVVVTRPWSRTERSAR